MNPSYLFFCKIVIINTKSYIIPGHFKDTLSLVMINQMLQLVIFIKVEGSGVTGIYHRKQPPDIVFPAAIY